MNKIVVYLQGLHTSDIKYLLPDNCGTADSVNGVWVAFNDVETAEEFKHRILGASSFSLVNEEEINN